MSLPTHRLGGRFKLQRFALPFAQATAQGHSALSLHQLHGTIWPQADDHGVRTQAPALALAFHAPTESDFLAFTLSLLGPQKQVAIRGSQGSVEAFREIHLIRFSNNTRAGEPFP
jgi:hypothetical protein